MTKPLTKAERREQMGELRDAILEINDDLESKREELKELLNEIDTLKESKKWRVEAFRFLKAQK
jgi:hypothetical protein